jgi:ATP-dependent DNA helicase DinG
MKQEDWSIFFPYESPRDEQSLIINKAIDSFKSGKRFFIIEAGTGIGKSAIGFTLSKALDAINNDNNSEYLPGGIFLTTQKILQDQYMKDFEVKGLKSIKSSSNYKCRHSKGNTCAQSMRLLKTADKGSRHWNTCMFKCPYRNSKTEFIESREGVTNFPYFLAETQYAGKIKPKNTIVLDEAHNISMELSKFIEVVVTQKFCKDFLKINIPKFKNQSDSFDWITSQYIPKLSSRFKHMKSVIEQHSLKKEVEKFVSIARQFELLDKHLCKMRRFVNLYNSDNWIFNDVPQDQRKSRRLEFKPVDVSSYSEDMVFRYGKNVILMSATILNREAFCELLGIKQSEAEFISMPSPFPRESRPILFFPIGKMSYNEIDRSLPKLAKAVEGILDNHKNEKGIIHCHTFRIANYIKNNLRSRRILIHNSENREEVLSKHKSSKRPTVLLSPSMTEGVDLAGDISRFQVICKIPYPFLGDKLIKKKMNKWKWWYGLETSKTIVQAVGRSVRNKEDHAVTYILDSDWDYFFRKNNKSFPEDFKACLS